MPMNPNFLCCIGAELKNSTQQTTRMTQVYLYRAFEDDTLSDMLSAGFFNEAVGVLRKDDLLLLYSPNETVAKWTYARVSNVDRDGVTVAQIGIDATAISVDTTGYSNLSGNNLQEILNNLDTTLTTINNAFVKKDGSSVMTGPLKFRAGSFVGAIAGGLGDGISIYKLKSDDSIDSEVASLTKENGFTPGTTNAQDIGSSSLKWKDLYVARVIASVLNNGADISVPTTAGTMALTSDIKNSTVSVQLDGSDVDSFTLNQSSNKTINIPAANKDLSNLTSTGKNIGNWSSNVTNCITEIPQDINLTLSSAGQLKLLAGSKLYIPNGSGVFTEIPITSDKIRVSGISIQCVEVALFNKADLTFSQLFEVNPSKVCSGSTDTLAGQSQHLWYDTTNNLIKYYGNDGVTNNYYAAFPLGLVTGNGSQITSIDQVFNGAGYVGHHAFVLPGVKALLPEGFNSDGTLKCFTRTTPSVAVIEMNTGTNNGYTRVISIIGGNPANNTASYVTIKNRSEAISTAWVRQYISSENIIVARSSNNGPFVEFTGGTYPEQTPFVFYNYDGTSVTKFDVRLPFNSLDYNDSEYIAHCSMPSGRYVDLTLGASGANYTMPADGYLCLRKNSTAANQNIRIRGNHTGSTATAPSSDFDLVCSLQVGKGESVQVVYTVGGDTTWFNFVYANGAK